MSHTARILKFAVSSLAILTATACGGGDSNGGTQPLPPSITLSASPTALTVQKGATGTVTLSSTRANVTGAVAISIDGLPAGVTATSNPAQLDASTSSATISVAVASSVSVGTYTATVHASASGTSATATYSLTVVEPPDFSLTATPAAVTVSSAANGISAIALARTGAFSGAVTFAMQSAQAGITGAFAPASTTDNATSLTISATTAVPVGSYPVTVTGNGAGIGDRSVTVTVNVAAAPSFSVSALPAALSIDAGSSATSTVTIARVGGFAAEVASALTSTQAGITGTFVPPSTAGTSTVVTVSVAASVPVGAYTATVTSSSTGQPNKTATIAITVNAQPKIAIALTATALNLANTNSGTSTVNITRTNFANAVTLASTGQPAGMTVSFNQSPTTTNASVATVSVGTGVAAGSYPLTITASGAGVTSVTSALTVTVPTPVFIEELFCTTSVPVWFAYQDGEGTWTRVTPTITGANSQFRFPIGSAYGAIAVMRTGTFNGVLRYQTVYTYGTRDELASWRNSYVCPTLNTPSGLNRLLTISGFNASTHFAFVRIGSFLYLPSAPGTTNFLDVPLGVQSIFSMRQLRTSAVPELQFADRYAISRNVPQASTPLPAIDFDGVTGIIPVSNTVTIQNLQGDAASTSSPFIFAGAASGISTSNTTGTAAQRLYYTVPVANRVAGDVDEVTVTAGDNTDPTFGITRFNRVVGAVGAQPYVVSLGAKIAPTTINAVVSGGYTRPRIQLTIPAEYDQTATININPMTSGGNFEGTSHAVLLMGGYRALRSQSTNVDFTLPDLSVAEGFNTLAVLPRGSCSISTSIETWTLGGINDNSPGRVYRRVSSQKTVTY